MVRTLRTPFLRGDEKVRHPYTPGALVPSKTLQPEPVSGLPVNRWTSYTNNSRVERRGGLSITRGQRGHFSRSVGSAS